MNAIRYELNDLCMNDLKKLTELILGELFLMRDMLIIPSGIEAADVLFTSISYFDLVLQDAIHCLIT